MSVGISINPAKKAEARARAAAEKTAQAYAAAAPAPSSPSAPAPKAPATWDEAAQQTAQQLGVQLPSDFKKTVQFAAQKYLWNTAWGSFDQMLVSKPQAFAEYNGAQAVKTYKENPSQLYTDALYGAGLRYQNVSQFGAPDKQAALDEAKGAIQNFAQSAAKLGVSPADIQNTVRSGAQSQVDFYKNMPRESGLLDSAIGLAINSIIGTATSGLSLPMQVAAQAAVSLGQGASVEDTIKNIGAQLAGGQMVEALKGVSSQITNPELKAAFNGAAQGATTAALLGKDVTQAALISAGVSAGTTAGERLSTESAGQGLKMPGQAKAPSAAGEGSFRTDVAGTAPEIGTGTGLYASPTALLTKQLAPYSTQIGDVISGGDGTVQSRYSSAADLITPPSLMQYVPEYQPPESTSGSMKRGLSGEEKKALSEALSLGFGSLFGGGGSDGAQTTYSASDGTQQQIVPVAQYSPGSQALAQALRIGDVGAPIFGADEDKGRKAGWNVESLRYMGDVGEA